MTTCSLSLDTANSIFIVDDLLMDFSMLRGFILVGLVDHGERTGDTEVVVSNALTELTRLLREGTIAAADAENRAPASGRYTIT